PFLLFMVSFFFQAEDGIRDRTVTGVQTCALPISAGLCVAPGSSLATDDSDSAPPRRCQSLVRSPAGRPRRGPCDRGFCDDNPPPKRPLAQTAHCAHSDTHPPDTHYRSHSFGFSSAAAS